MDPQLLRVIENSDRLIDTATKLGVAYAGYRSAKNWTGSLNALIALKLATSGNIVAGAAGVGVLTFIGLTQPGGMLSEDTGIFSTANREPSETTGGFFDPIFGANAPIWRWLTPR